MQLSRQRKRYIEREIKKIDPTIVRDIQNIAFYNGIYAATEAVEKAMRKEFGFGDKRLKRLEEAIESELEGEKNERD